MPESLARIEFFSFIALAVWLVFYQVRSARRRSAEYEAEQRASTPGGETPPGPPPA